MPRGKTFAPWKISDALQLTVRSFRDGDDGTAIHVHEHALGDGEFVRVYDVGRHDWRRLDVEFTVGFDGEGPEDVLHQGEATDEAARMLVAVRCRSTKLRFVHALERATSSTWRGSLRLARDNVQGVAELTPLFVRRTDVEGAGGGSLARAAAALLAEGRAVDLRIDEGANPFEGGLDVRWEDFRGSHDPHRKGHAEDVYDVDVGGSEPRLFLNARYGHLAALLDEPNPGTPEAVAAKTAALAIIGQGTLVHLFHAAVAEVVRDPETGEALVPDGWPRHVVDRLLPVMYAERSSPDARFANLLEELDSAAGRRNLERRLASAVQEDQIGPRNVTRILSGGGS